MTKFLKLTEVYTDGRNIPLVINAGYIMSIKKSSNGKDTHICMTGDKHYFFVKETVQEIEAML